eukprot:2680516-Amphidinium_carterae.2
MSGVPGGWSGQGLTLGRCCTGGQTLKSFPLNPNSPVSPGGETGQFWSRPVPMSTERALLKNLSLRGRF